MKIVEGVESPAEETGDESVARVGALLGTGGRLRWRSFGWRASLPDRNVRIHDGIGDAGDLHHFGDVVHANDVRAAQDAGGDGGGGAPDARRRSGARRPDAALAR